MLYLSGKVRPDYPAMVALGQGGPKAAPGQVWAADNGRFANPRRYNDARYLAWLGRQDPTNCLFATAPDVVGDAVSTLLLSGPLYHRIRDAGYRVALVAQDGLERLREFIPWPDIDALFIGGTTEWKLGPAAASLAAEAKARGKWLHMGRVNSRRRINYAASIGCDSVDGTMLKFDPSRPVGRWTAEATARATKRAPKRDRAAYMRDYRAKRKAATTT